jgi:hypothetical protein
MERLFWAVTTLWSYSILIYIYFFSFDTEMFSYESQFMIENVGEQLEGGNVARVLIKQDAAFDNWSDW